MKELRSVTNKSSTEPAESTPSATNATSSASSASSIYEACKSGDLVACKRLITRLNVNVPDESSSRRSSCLHIAAGYGRVGVCRYLLQSCGAKVDARDIGGLRPLHNASAYGHREVAELLIEVSRTLTFLSFVFCYSPFHLH
jgi:ankyrin repeat protein